MEIPPDTGDGALKRPCPSAAPCATQQHAKRVCLSDADTETTIAPLAKSCLECNTVEHTSETCTAVLTHCQTQTQQVQPCGHSSDVEPDQPGPLDALSRALSEAATHALPRRHGLHQNVVAQQPEQLPAATMAFSRQNGATPAMEGVSSDRLAMIAVESPDVSNPRKHGRGMFQSGMNLIPLGPRRSSLSHPPAHSTPPTRSEGTQHSEHLLKLRAKVEATRSQGSVPQAAATTHPANHLLGFNAAPLGPPPAGTVYSRRDAPPLVPAPASSGHGRLNNPPLRPAPKKRSKRKSKPAMPRKPEIGSSSVPSHGLPKPVSSAPASSLPRLASSAPAYGLPRRAARPIVLNMTPGAIEQAKAFEGDDRNRKPVERYGAENMGIFVDLIAHTQHVVRGAVDPSRVRNTGFDEEAVNKALEAASDILAPLILRDKNQPQQNLPESRFTQVIIDGEGGLRITGE